MKNTLILTEKEQKTKKQWLLLFVVIFFFNIFYYFTASQALPSSPLAPTTVFLFQIFFTSLFAVIQYYYIYRKNGTRWLTFFLYCIPISLVISAAIFFFKPESFPKYPSLTLQGFSILLSILFWIASYRLRKINQRIQTDC